MTREGIDYSAKLADPAKTAKAFKAAGKTFAVRYVSRVDSKNLHLAEAKALAAAGLDVALVWEQGRGDALKGYDGGVTYAKIAKEQAKACGMPDGRPIYFAVDWDAQPGQMKAIAQYLKGAASVLGKKNVGVYGSYAVVKYMLDNGMVDWAWQTYAWSGGRRDPRAQLHQYKNGVTVAGVNVDLDTAYAADFGQWRPGQAPDQPKVPKFPFPAGDYIALANGDRHAHSGKVAADRPKIKQWEHRMVERGWRLHDDGMFDEEADRVARKFQREKGLEVDGKVGPKTWAAAWREPIS